MPKYIITGLDRQQNAIAHFKKFKSFSPRAIPLFVTDKKDAASFSDLQQASYFLIEVAFRFRKLKKGYIRVMHIEEV